MTAPGARPSRGGGTRGLPRSIWALGFVSLGMDVSSELVHSLLPVYMTTVLGASMTTVGLIEGIAEGVTAVTKVFSGAISDAVGRRKLPAVLGYGLSALTKPVFALAPTIGWVMGARWVDRIGKGIRGAPRDALVAEIAPPGMRGAAFGLRQALDSTGAFIGPLLAVAFMLLLRDHIAKVMWVAVPPALAAVLLLAFGVREPRNRSTDAPPPRRITLADAGRLPRRYWLVVGIGASFTLARFSEAFLILRARDTGLALSFVPVVMIVMNVAYSGLAYPAGAAADTISARRLLAWGLAALAAADLVLAAASGWIVTLLGAALWGVHMALTQGLLTKLVADSSPAVLRGTAFGIANLAAGVAVLLASVIAGALWSRFGPSATFLAGAGFAVLAASGVAVLKQGNQNLSS